MKAFSLLFISLISLPVFASYQRGIVRVQDNNYICETMNNDASKLTVSVVIFNYTCSDDLETVFTTKHNCVENCEINGYSIKTFDGPETCKDGSVSTPTCGIEFSVNE